MRKFSAAKRWTLGHALVAMFLVIRGGAAPAEPTASETRTSVPLQKLDLKRNPPAIDPILLNTLRILRTHFVFQTRLEPMALLEAGYRALEREYWPAFEVSAGHPMIFQDKQNQAWISLCRNTDPTENLSFCEPFRWRDQTETLPRGWHVLRVSTKAFLANNPEGIRELAQHVSYLVAQLARVTGVASEQILSVFVNGFLENLDPHSRLLTNQEYSKLRLGTDGQFSGVGLVLDDARLLPEIRETIPQSAAERAAIQPHDVLLRVNGIPALFLPGDVLSREFQSTRNGNAISVSLFRPASQRILDMTLQRSTVSTRTALRVPIPQEPDILFVRLVSFSRNTAEELQELYFRAKQTQPRLRGIVLDLRDNPGGLLDEAVEVADLFLQKGTIVEVHSRSTTEVEEATLKRNAIDLPLAVLINGASASASEIVAGALRDHGRGFLIGERSFGKGSVQSVFEVGRGSALKVTVAYHFTPRKTCIQGVGISPHAEIKLIEEKDGLLWMHGTEEHEDPDLNVPVGVETDDGQLHAEIWTSFRPRRHGVSAPLRELDTSFPLSSPMAGASFLEDDPMARIAIRALRLLKGNRAPALESVFARLRAEEERPLAAMFERLASRQKTVSAEAIQRWLAGKPAGDTRFRLLGVRASENPNSVVAWDVVTSERDSQQHSWARSAPQTLVTHLSRRQERQNLQPLALVTRESPFAPEKTVGMVPVESRPPLPAPQVEVYKAKCPNNVRCNRYSVHTTFAEAVKGTLNLIPLVDPTVQLSSELAQVSDANGETSMADFTLELDAPVGEQFRGFVAGIMRDESGFLLGQWVLAEVRGNEVIPVTRSLLSAHQP